MKRVMLLLVVLFLNAPALVFAQNWGLDQVEQADKGRDVSYLTQAEREAILYINLCRLYPVDFVRNEVREYELDNRFDKTSLQLFPAYKKSLMNELLNARPVAALKFNDTLYQHAKCSAAAISRTGGEGRERKNCPKEKYSECLSFALVNGREIVLQWLFDVGVGSLGHREMCLNPEFSIIGIKSGEHDQYNACAVAEFD